MYACLFFNNYQFYLFFKNFLLFISLKEINKKKKKKKKKSNWLIVVVVVVVVVVVTITKHTKALYKFSCFSPLNCKISFLINSHLYSDVIPLVKNVNLISQSVFLKYQQYNPAKCCHLKNKAISCANFNWMIISWGLCSH